MSLLFDENLSPRLPGLLAVEYPGSSHVHDVGPGAAEDEEIWNYAAVNHLTIVSRDSDFRHRTSLRGAPPKVIWVCLRNGATANVEAAPRAQQAAIQAFLTDPQAALFVLT